MKNCEKQLKNCEKQWVSLFLQEGMEIFSPENFRLTEAGKTSAKSFLKKSFLITSSKMSDKLCMLGRCCHHLFEDLLKVSVLANKKECLSGNHDPLVILYYLYARGEVSSRQTFFLRDMSDVSDISSKCAGLAEKYPSFIACSFTHGLDEIRIFPNEKNMEDVIDLISNNTNSL